MQKQGKNSDQTWNSPVKNDYRKYYQRKKSRNNNGGTDSLKSAFSQKSKYSSSSKLTKSQLFSTISKKAGQQRNDQTLKQRDTEIQILQGSLQVLERSQKNLLYNIGKILKTSADQADNLLKSLKL